MLLTYLGWKFETNMEIGRKNPLSKSALHHAPVAASDQLKGFPVALVDPIHGKVKKVSDHLDIWLWHKMINPKISGLDN